jgi:tetratricopeptide (TPR) repeat protein
MKLAARVIAAPAPVAPAEPARERARRLVDQGEVEAALAMLDDAIAADPLDEEALVLRAVVHQARADHGLAARDAERAIVLERSLAFAHLLAASSRARLGDRAEARRHARNARRLLCAAERTPRTIALLDACTRLERALASSGERSR